MRNVSAEDGSLKVHIQSEVKKRDICVIGGTGFVGRHLVNQLVKQGCHVRLLTRHRERHRDLMVWPGVEMIEANVHDVQVLHKYFEGCGTVINLAAILNEKRHGDFHIVHVDLPRKIVQACMAHGVRRLLHMSALNANVRGLSHYLRSKGEGEGLVHSASTQGLQVTSFRPSVIFGPDDHLFNRFAQLLKRAPWVPVPCATTRFSPIFVGDVVHCFMIALQDRATLGQRYDLCGPQSYTLQQLMEYTAQVLGTHRTIIGLGRGASRVMAGLMEFFPGKPFTRDNYLSIKMDSVCPGEFPAVFGTHRTALEAVVPFYLDRRDQRARYYGYRRTAGRDS